MAWIESERKKNIRSQQEVLCVCMIFFISLALALWQARNKELT